MLNLRGSIVALVTPFTETDGIDYDNLKRLLDFHIENGTEAIVLNGTTGESPTISIEEFDIMIKFAVDYVNGRIPIIAGTGSNNTQHAIQMSRIATDQGADALLVVSPYYNKPTDSGLRSYFGSIARSTSLPIIMYNVPGRTASSMSTSLIYSLAEEFDNIIGIKEAAGDMLRIMDLIENRPQGFLIYSGDDSLAVSTILMGGDGCISVVANQIPKIFSQMLNSALDGEVELARKLHYKYYNLMKLNFIETNPIPIKTALHKMGLIDLNFRSPMCEMENDNASVLLQELNKLNCIGNPSNQTAVITEA